MYSALIGGLLPCAACCVVGLRWQAAVSCACVPLMVSCSGVGLPMHARLLRLVTKRRNSWACIGNPNPEQETSKGTHAQETSANQRRPTTQHAAQGSNPPIGARYMQLAKIPHTHQTTPPAISAAIADQHGTHRGRNRYHPSAHTTQDEAPGQLPGAQKHV